MVRPSPPHHHQAHGQTDRRCRILGWSRSSDASTFVYFSHEDVRSHVVGRSQREGSLPRRSDQGSSSACPGGTPPLCSLCHRSSSAPPDPRAPCRSCRSRGRGDSPDRVRVHAANRARPVVERPPPVVRLGGPTGNSAVPGAQLQVERSERLRSQEAGSTSVHTSDRAQGWKRLTLRKPCRTEHPRPAAYRMIRRILARSRPSVARGQVALNGNDDDLSVLES